MTTRLPACFLVGATATGKSEIAVEMAERLGMEIVSADSRQLFRGMEIGTAAPDAGLRRRVPHRLVGVASPSDCWSAGRYMSAALEALREIAARGMGALIVGGSGLYVKALRQGLARLPADATVRERLRQDCARHGSSVLHERLLRMDPDAARRIHPRNVERLVRALEIYQITGRPASTLQREGSPRASVFPAPMYGLDMPRKLLYRRIEARVDRMFEAGLLDEVRRLLARGFGEGWPAYRTLGYPECERCIRGEIDEATARAEIKRKTRHFARRQLTWFRGQADLEWFAWTGEGLEALVERLCSRSRRAPPVPLPEAGA